MNEFNEILTYVNELLYEPNQLIIKKHPRGNSKF